MEEINCGSILLTKEFAMELQDGVPVIKVLKSDIVRLQVLKGVSAEKPQVQFVSGILFLIPGLWSMKGFFLWLLKGGVLYFDSTFALFLLVPIGAWLIWSSIRKRTILLIHTRDSRRKFPFPKSVTGEEVNKFIEEARSGLSYDIENRLNED